MWLNLIAFVLVLAITFMHSIFGFYSGLINLFCTLVAAVLTLGFWELATDLLSGATGLHPGYVGAVVLILLFVGTLSVLRAAADNLIRGNVSVPSWLDWGGASVCGFVNAQVTVGILVLGIMALPLGGSVLAYERIAREEGEQDPDHPEKVLYAHNPMWLRTVDMTVGLVNLIIDGPLSGSTRFTDVYPDFGDAMWYSANTVQPGSNPAPYRDKTGDGFDKGVRVVEWGWVERVTDVRYRQEQPTAKRKSPNFEAIGAFEPLPGNGLLRVRLELHRSAADRKNKSPLQLFRPTMLRLVGDVPASGGKRPRQHTPIILRGADPQLDGAPRLVDVDNNFSLAEPDATIDAYFEVDQRFVPRFIEYRRHARAGVTGEPVAAENATALNIETSAERAAREAAAATTFSSIASQHSRGGNNMPDDFTVSGVRRSGSDLEWSGDSIKSGRISGTLTKLREDGGTKVAGFDVPSDKRMVQVGWTPREARTLAGQVLRFTDQVNQYFCEDNTGTTYPLVGYIGRVKRSDQDFYEIYYAGPDPATAGFRGMLDFKQVQRQELWDADESQVTLLFLVKPGVIVTRIKNQTDQGHDVRVSAGP